MPQLEPHVLAMHQVNLKRIAMWLTEIIDTLSRPELLYCSPRTATGQHERTFAACLYFPSNEVELDTWVEPTPATTPLRHDFASLDRLLMDTVL